MGHDSLLIIAASPSDLLSYRTFSSQLVPDVESAYILVIDTGRLLGPARTSRAADDLPRFDSFDPGRKRGMASLRFEEVIMASGTVKWFNAQKGFGFIAPENGGGDVFVHISAVERAGLGTLQDGQKIDFELVADRRSGRTSADSLQVT